MPVEWTALVGPLLTLGANVVAGAGEAQRYRKKCRLLKSRVQMISTHLDALRQTQWTPDPLATKDTLKNLGEVLRRAEVLLQSCRRKTKAFDFFHAFKNKDEFAFVNEQISHILETFHLANYTLLLLDRNNRIFMVVLDTLIEDGACGRLPQEKKDALERSMSTLPHVDIDNMPPEKRRRLELITRGLREESYQRPSDSASASSGNRGQNHNDDPVLKKVADLAEALVEEAKAVRSHNKEEVQRVAHLAQKVIYFLPHLQPLPLLTAENQETITKLQDELERARNTITITESRPTHCGAPGLMTSSFWRDQAKHLVELGNGIEQSYQTLTIKVAQHITSNHA